MIASALMVTAVLQSPDTAATAVEKSLELAVAYSQTLSQWSYLILAGSVALLLRDFKQRPKSKWFRRIHWLFVPGWALLIWSIYEGMRVQGAHISYAMASAKNSETAITEVNLFAALQQTLMLSGLIVFGFWLVLVLYFWTKSDGEFVEDRDEC